MDRKINILVRNKKYSVIGLVLVIVFIFAAVQASKRIYKEAKIKAELTSSSIAINGVGILKNTFSTYKNKVSMISSLSYISEIDNIKKLNILNDLKRNDTTLYAVWSYQDGKYLNSENALYEKYRDSSVNIASTDGQVNVMGPYKTFDGKQVVVISTYINRDNKTIFYGLDVDLKMVHSAIAANTDFWSAYVTVVSNSRKYIYHPDEKKIGQAPSDELEWKNIEAAFKKSEGYFEKIYSEYLELDLYRYYFPQVISNNNKWMFTSNVPTFGFEEYLNNVVMQILILALVALLGFVILFSMGIIRWRKEFVSRKEAEQENLELLLDREQKTKEAISRELENLKSGLNPHFLFNSLSSLKILVNKNTQLAGQFATSLSSLYRYMLDYQNLDTVPLEDEIEFTENYIFLQQIRFKDKVFVDISVFIEKLIKQVPPISVQTLVENAIKHNQITRENPLHINIYNEDNMLVVENNISILKSSEASTGIGQKNLASRYRLLSAKECQFFSKDGKYYAKIPLL